MKATAVLRVLAGLRRSGIKGAFLLHPAAVIWHHLLLQGAEAYRGGTPAPRRNLGQSMSTICLACCRACVALKEWLQCSGWHRETLSVQAVLWLTAQLMPGQVKLRPQRTRGSDSHHFRHQGQHFCCQTSNRLIKVEPWDVEQKTWLQAMTKNNTSGN